MRLFNRITLRTPESVELEFTLAGIGNRALALAIDYLIWGIILALVFTCWAIASTQFPILQGNAPRQWIAAIAFLLGFAVYVGYFVYFETLWQGQTPGKRWTKIRVIREDGRPTGLQQAALRALLRPVDDLFSIGAWCIMLGAKEKRLGDWVAGTLVIQEDRLVAAANFPLSKEAQAIADRLLVTTNIAALIPDDFAVIREYLQRRKVMESNAKLKLSRQLAQQVQNIIELEGSMSGITDDVFLEAIYLAYQQQSN
ncbi:RDD family protein [Tumidithrix elongata RA019]|uniref:RDD family protein n=1 Tax=Tumidithrix elongata BACA0141 TaxID=2716417 RepID=A0AAW9Q867_9CYAN|nr:RDD family protein [Tumidithrix elongata RA019]